MTTRRPIRTPASLGAAVVVGWPDTCSLHLLAIAADAQRSTSAVRRPLAARHIATLVPAHNEEMLADRCVRALTAQEYAAGYQRVVVITANCSDRTAERARNAGAIVWERTASDLRGKGHALSCAIDRIWSDFPETEIVGVVDADCLASSNLCSAWANAVEAGAAAAKADYRISNPSALAAATRRWAGFALMHRIRDADESRLRLSNGLFGTGMAFAAQTLRELPWSSFSITEDVEYHARLVLTGRTTAFVTEAWVDIPVPLSETDAQAQQLRWESGSGALARATVPRLVRDRVCRWDVQPLHLTFGQTVPPQSLLMTGLLGGLHAGVATRSRRLAVASALGGVMQNAYVVFRLRVLAHPSRCGAP